jgi:hypothetical protein
MVKATTVKLDAIAEGMEFQTEETASNLNHEHRRTFLSVQNTLICQR